MQLETGTHALMENGSMNIPKTDPRASSAMTHLGASHVGKQSQTWTQGGAHIRVNWAEI